MMAESSERRHWFQRHPALTCLAFALVGCVVALILSELVVRIFLPEWAPTREERVKFWAYDQLLGWAHMPNHQGRFDHPDFSVEVSINSHGMRDKEYSIERTSKHRMMVLGDSYGWGFGVEQEQRFSDVLEHGHPDWEILNASVSGYGTDQEFLFLRDKGVMFKPEVVLLLFCENDFVDNISDERYWHFKPFFSLEAGHLTLQNVPVPFASVRQVFDRFLLGRTYLGPRLYYSAENLVGRLKASRAHRRGESPAVTSGAPDSADYWRSYEITSHLLGAMDEVCQDNRYVFVLVSVPMGAEARAAAEAICEERKILYLALDPYFESAGPSATLPHDAHWNAKGHHIAAEAIDEFLRASRIFTVSVPKDQRRVEPR